MGFALKAFAVGAATALSEKLDKDEKAAEESARATVNRLSSKLTEREKETSERLKGYSNTIGALKAYHPGWTEQQLYNIARNPLVAEQTLSAFKDGRINPATFDPQKYANLADVVPNQKEAMARITEEEKAQQLGTVPSVPQSSFFDTKDRAARIQQDRIAQYSKGLNVTPEQLYGADKAAPLVEGDKGVRYDMSQVTKAPPIEQQEARILAEITKAKDSNDPQALAKATESAAQFAASKRLASASLSAEQALIDKIMLQPENAKLSPEAQLRKRQTLEIKPGEGLQRLTATDLSRAARGAFNDALASSLGKGKFSSVTNQVTGETTTVPSDLVKPEELQAAKIAARQGIINLYTDPRTGLPISNLYKNALIEIGATFNPDGTVSKVDSGKAAPAAPAAPATPDAPVVNPDSEKFIQLTTAAREKGEIESHIKKAIAGNMTKDKMLSIGITEEEYNKYVPKATNKPMTVLEEINQKNAARLKEIDDRLNQAIAMRNAAAKSSDLDSIKMYQQQVDAIQREKDKLKPNQPVR